MFGEELNEIFDSLDSAIAGSSYEWTIHHRLTWVYGAICGWDDISLEEFKTIFGWNDEIIDKLKSYHKECIAMF